MCALGDLNQRERLSDDRLAEIFGHASVADTLRAINFTGGEPTLRKDLPQLVARLVDSCPNLESFSLNSNGMLRPSFERIRGVIDVARSRGKKLYLFISLDGVGRLHDEIRGVRGAFEKTVRTIDAVRALNVPATQLSLGVSATATYKNIDHLGDVLQFAVERDIAVSFTFPMETDVYMNNADRVGRFHADREMVDRFVAFLDTLEPHADRISPPMSFLPQPAGDAAGGAAHRAVHLPARWLLPGAHRRGAAVLALVGPAVRLGRGEHVRGGLVRRPAASDRADHRGGLLQQLPEPVLRRVPVAAAGAAAGRGERLMAGISVVVICRNEARYLDGCLAAIRGAAEHTRMAVQVVVVDGRSTDATVAVATAWRPVLDLDVVRCTRAGYAHQRNAGVAAARHPWVAFVSADVRVGPDWLAEVERVPVHEYDVLLGRFTLTTPPGRRPWLAALTTTVYPTSTDDPFVERCSTVHLLARKEILAAVPFDERLPACEDKDLAVRLRAVGARVGALGHRPEHIARESVPAALTKLYREGVALGLLARRHGPGFPDLFGWRRATMRSAACLLAGAAVAAAVPSVPAVRLLAGAALWIAAGARNPRGWSKRDRRFPVLPLVGLHAAAMTAAGVGYLVGRIRPAASEDVTAPVREGQDGRARVRAAGADRGGQPGRHAAAQVP
ncbi:hypothetical protein GCM10018954_076690 [Kutzneria kofuensis]